ncbi:MAG: trigger factor [Candidatus Moraniibacteriota bacterium]
MDVSVKNLSNSRVELSISLPWEEWKGELQHAAEHLGQELKISGFRAGKVPAEVVEQRVGKAALLAEAAEHAVSHVYPKALAESKIDALGRPQVELGAVKEGEALTLTVTTDVMPKAKLASGWKKAVQRANKENASEKTEVKEEEVETELKRLADMRAALITVNRPAQNGDTALVDFVVRQAGAIIEGGKAENHPLILGSGAFIPGFEEQIIGMQAGEEKTFTLAFPAEYHAKHLADKPAEFTVTLRAVQEKETPELNDDFAKSVGRFETLEALKANLKTGIQEEAQVRDKEARRTRILDALLDGAEIEYPVSLIEEELGRMLREFDSQARMMGMDLATMLNQMNKSEEDLKKEWEPQAKKRLGAHLVLEAVAESLELEVDQEAVEAEMNKTLGYYKTTKEAEKKIDLPRLYTAVKGQLLNQEALDTLEKM